MPKANIEKFSNDPPVNAEKRLSASLELDAIHCLKTEASTPGTGIMEITRVRKIIPTMISSFRLMSRVVRACLIELIIFLSLLFCI